jgi:hypothetical protein
LVFSFGFDSCISIAPFPSIATRSIDQEEYFWFQLFPDLIVVRPRRFPKYLLPRSIDPGEYFWFQRLIHILITSPFSQSIATR